MCVCMSRDLCCCWWWFFPFDCCHLIFIEHYERWVAKMYVCVYTYIHIRVWVRTNSWIKRMFYSLYSFFFLSLIQRRSVDKLSSHIHIQTHIHSIPFSFHFVVVVGLFRFPCIILLLLLLQQWCHKWQWQCQLTGYRYIRLSNCWLKSQKRNEKMNESRNGYKYIQYDCMLHCTRGKISIVEIHRVAHFHNSGK